MTTRKRNRIAKTVSAVAAMLAIAGCVDSGRMAYTHFVTVSPDGWNTLDGREFSPFDADSIAPGRYRMLVAVRHGERFPYTSLWLELEQSDSTGVVRLDTVNIAIATPAGRFLGKGRYGLLEVVDTLPGSINVTPGWQLSVRHIMRDEDVAGVNNIGLILLK